MMSEFDLLLDDLDEFRIRRAIRAGDYEDRPMFRHAPAGAYRRDPGVDLAKALAPGAVAARARKMEATRHCFSGVADKLLRPGEPLAKAPAGTEYADMARAQPSSTDTHEHIQRAARLFSQLRANGKLTPRQAADFEARLIRCQSDEDGRTATPDTAGRRAATARAAAILSDLARSGSLSAEQVAFYESHLHAAQDRLGAA